MSLNDKFSGLPMDALIGGPLNVATESQTEEDITLKVPLLKITPVPALDKETQPPED